MNPDQVTIEILPMLLQEIAALIGIPATLKIVEWRGGIGLYIPKDQLPEGHELMRRIGRVAAEKLQSAYAGETLAIPLARAAVRAVRNAEIRAKRLHVSESQLAREYGMLDRTIRRVCEGMKDDKQECLF